MRIRVSTLLVATVLVLSALVIGLRGTNPQTTAYQVSGLQTATSIQGVSLGPALWSDSFAGASWHLSQSNTTQTSFSQIGSLNLNVTFEGQLISDSVVITRDVNISMDQDPVLIIQLTVSQGVHYGIRFSGISPYGTAFDAWSESSPLQHREGLGSVENISANLPVQTYLANGQAPVPGSRITRLWLYLEATAGTRGTYSMKVFSIKTFRLAFSAPSKNSNSVSGNFQGIVVNLNLPAPNASLFQAYVDFNIRGSPALQYTPFLMQGTVVVAQGFTYVQSSVTPYQTAVLTTTLISSFPNFLIEQNSTAVVIAATAGSISQFGLVNVSFKYTSTPIQSAGSINPETARFMIAYYFAFLFVTPIAAAILVVKMFHRED